MSVLRLALPLAALLVAGPALAQQPADHAQHHPPAAAAAPAADQPAADKPADDMHARCQQIMGAKMAGPPPHDHAKDKMGHAVGMKGAPPSKEEMAAMHQRCAEMMAKSEAPAKK